MTKDEMYEDIKLQLRGTDVSTLEALANTLKKTGTEMKQFYKGEKHLYVRCDVIPCSSISIIEFLANSNGLTCRVVALSDVIQFNNKKEKISIPYINIYKS